MSILSRLKLDRHLDERAMAAVWTDAAVGGRPATDAHLDRCAECRDRLAGFSSWMEGLRLEALAEADEAFPADRLAAQHAQIFRRLEAAERPARVIAFPRFARPMAARTSSARRWVASAAAAGVIVGIALGQFMDLRHSILGPAGGTETVQTVAGTAAGRAAGPGVQPATFTLSDEEIMARIEEIDLRRMPDTLVAYDAITPRARDYPR